MTSRSTDRTSRRRCSVVRDAIGMRDHEHPTGPRSLDLEAKGADFNHDLPENYTLTNIVLVRSVARAVSTRTGDELSIVRREAGR